MMDDYELKVVDRLEKRARDSETAAPEVALLKQQKRDTTIEVKVAEGGVVFRN
jgi:hypothetical protein